MLDADFGLGSVVFHEYAKRNVQNRLEEGNGCIEHKLLVEVFKLSNRCESSMGNYEDLLHIMMVGYMAILSVVP